MPRRFFRKFAFKRDHVTDQWFMTPFRHLLHDTRLWGIRRKNVVPAFAVGLFVMWMPFPGHLLMACIIALMLRVNIPVAAVTTLLSNPLTMGPMYFLGYRFGAWLLSDPVAPLSIEMTLDWVTNVFVGVWQPMLLGCILLGSATSLLGLFVLDVFWRTRIADYKATKRKKRR
jgi:hypothetical protein